MNSSSDNYDDKNLINRLRLINHSGTACSLEALVKPTKTGLEVRMGGNKDISLGFKEELDLTKLAINEGSYVTAFANVTWGKDFHGNMWFKYSKEAKVEATFIITGPVDSTKVTFHELKAY